MDHITLKETAHFEVRARKQAKTYCSYLSYKSFFVADRQFYVQQDQTIFLSMFFTYFQPSKRATRNNALIRSVNNESRMRFFFAGVGGSSCIFTLVLFVEIPLFELWCFTDVPAFAHQCFADSPTCLYQRCLIVHFVAPKTAILPPSKRKTSTKMLTRPFPFLLKLRVYKPQSYL